ncbi:hypothetical protein EDC01DRAFT_630281 [Geopyxis carbonaria]|nr:hypothetical protein EDC01DRAFT_630281 [Geopyxis carbonaria]
MTKFSALLCSQNYLSSDIPLGTCQRYKHGAKSLAQRSPHAISRKPTLIVCDRRLQYSFGEEWAVARVLGPNTHSRVQPTALAGGRAVRTARGNQASTTSWEGWAEGWAEGWTYLFLLISGGICTISSSSSSHQHQQRQQQRQQQQQAQHQRQQQQHATRAGTAPVKSHMPAAAARPPPQQPTDPATSEGGRRKRKRSSRKKKTSPDSVITTPDTTLPENARKRAAEDETVPSGGLKKMKTQESWPNPSGLSSSQSRMDPRN